MRTVNINQRSCASISTRDQEIREIVTNEGMPQIEEERLILVQWLTVLNRIVGPTNNLWGKKVKKH